MAKSSSGANILTVEQVKDTTAYTSVNTIQKYLRRDGFVAPIEFFYTDSITNFTYPERNGVFPIEIGVNSAYDPTVKPVIDKLSDKIRMAGLVIGENAETKSIQLARNLYEAFFILHEIGHTNAMKMQSIHGKPVANDEDNLYKRIYSESYADAFSIAYLKCLGINGSLVELVGESINDMRQNDERILKNAAHNKSSKYVVRSADFEHDTGDVIKRMLAIPHLTNLPPSLLQEKIKEISLSRVEDAFRDADFNKVAPLTHQKETEIRSDLANRADICIIPKLGQIDIGRHRVFMDCPQQNIQPPKIISP